MIHDLDSLFTPRSIAIVGASSDPTRLTGRPLGILRRHGFSGEIAVVHPRLDEIDGVRAHRSVSALPFVPEVVVVMIRAEYVPGIARDCGEKGVRHLVVLSSGFEETAEGKAVSAELKAIADHYGMGVVGPNSEGLWFLPRDTILTFGSAAMRDDLVGGPVAVLSQSGSIGASIMRRLNDTGVGADVFVSVGNETVLGAADYLAWITARTSVRVIVCFLEGLGDGRAFIEAAAAARAAGITVVVLKAGASEQGRLASASHTGKISTSATVYDSLFAQAGVVTVDTVEELAGAAALLTGPRLRPATGEGAGLTVIGLSGGSRSIIADACDRLGVPMTTLTAATTGELGVFFPSFGVTENPVDPTGQVLSDAELFPRTIRALAGDPNTRALLVQYANGGTGLLRRHLPVLREVVAVSEVPVLVSCLLDQLPATDPLRRELAEAGIAYAHDPTDAVTGLSLLFRVAAGADTEPIAPRVVAENEASVTDWEEVARLVEAAGIRTPREAIVPAAADTDAVTAALATAGLAYPVVVKPSPDDVQHKSELGLVHLDVGSLVEVLAALARIRDALGAGTRVVIQEFVRSELEILAVLQRDPDFGPVLGVGLGGFFVELLGEVSYVALPASPSQILLALDRTRLGRMLRGYRGGRAIDPKTVAERLSALGTEYAALRTPPRLLELNPLSVVGSGDLYAIDALVEAADE
ncbi:acetate--CoA ligase family protein [Streptosporangium sp. NPDC006013]|uniref:acetate--CoA ligase family protein n=1 Tax=Streptosporangium sp. NPDC006013 TaxID=3155596 RepID=UPI0033AC7C8B